MKPQYINRKALRDFIERKEKYLIEKKTRSGWKGCGIAYSEANAKAAAQAIADRDGKQTRYIRLGEK